MAQKKMLVVSLLCMVIAAGLPVSSPAFESGVIRGMNTVREPAGLDTTEFTIPETGCTLLIDLDIHILTVYLDGEVYRSYPVSGGTDHTPSPVGTWLVVNISDWGAGFGGTWIGLNVPWGQYGIHGTLKPWLIGKNNVSHGCIRMKSQDVNEVKKLVQIGSVVHIKQDSLPFRNMAKDVAGSDVMRIQESLKNLGFYTGTIDGIFGDGMEYAVRSFQKTYRMKVDGIVGRQTYEKIIEQEHILKESKREGRLQITHMS
jgi:hypothetical protein